MNFFFVHFFLLFSTQPYTWTSDEHAQSIKINSGQQRSTEVHRGPQKSTEVHWSQQRSTEVNRGPRKSTNGQRWSTIRSMSKQGRPTRLTTTILSLSSPFNIRTDYILASLIYLSSPTPFSPTLQPTRILANHIVLLLLYLIRNTQPFRQPPPTFPLQNHIWSHIHLSVPGYSLSRVSFSILKLNYIHRSLVRFSLPFLIQMNNQWSVIINDL